MSKENPGVNVVRILVDGYSLLHACRRHLPKTSPHSAMARDWLIRLLIQYQDAMHVPVTVVFDGMGNKSEATLREVHPHVEVLFSQGNRTADDLIERAAHKLLEYGQVLVVTDDYAEQNTIFSMGGTVASCDQFFADMQDAIASFGQTLDQFNRKTGKAYRQR